MWNSSFFIFEMILYLEKEKNWNQIDFQNLKIEFIKSFFFYEWNL